MRSTTIVEQPEGVSPEDAAEREGDVLIEVGPFPNYDDAYDALLSHDPLEDQDAAELPIGLP